MQVCKLLANKHSHTKFLLSPNEPQRYRKIRNSSIQKQFLHHFQQALATLQPRQIKLLFPELFLCCFLVKSTCKIAPFLLTLFSYFG